jgi:hypothetical protein
MAINPNSYGSAAGIAVFARSYANADQEFTDSTTPTLTQVETWIDEVSAILNVELADLRFSVPVTQSDAVRMLDSFVNQETAALVLGMHNQGRFGPTDRGGSNPGRFAILLSDIKEFLHQTAGGLEAIGASRTNTHETKTGSVNLLREDAYSDDHNATANSYT